MTIFLLVLLALLLLLLVLLAVPLQYQARFASDSNITLAARFSWSKLVVASYDISEGLRVTMLGFKISLEQGNRKTKNQGTTTKKKRSKKSGSKIPIRPLLSMARRVLRHIKPQRLESDLRVGFEDPYHTAIMGMVVQWLPISDKVKVIPVYDEEVVEGWFLVEGRVIPLALLVIAIREFAPVFFRNMNAGFKLSGRKVEKHV